MKRLRHRVYSEAEFKAEDRIGKIYISLLQPNDFQLNAQDDIHLERMRKVWTIMLANDTQKARIKLISEVMGINERNVKAIMDDAQYLFGDILRVDSEFEKALIVERQWQLFKKAKKAKDYEGASKILDRITKLKGYDREDGGIKREDLELPEITFTSNPKALLADTSGEYIEHEDLDLLEPEAVGVSASESAD